MTTTNTHYNTDGLRALELLTEEHAPFVAGARTLQLELPGGGAVIVAFALPALDSGGKPWGRIATSMATVAAAVEVLAHRI